MGHDSSTILFAALTLLAALLWPVSPADAQTDRPRPLAHNPLQKWKLTWSDEFNGAGPVDPAKWVNMVGGQGWGNHELEYYTAGTENAEQRGGNLVITARDDGPAYSCCTALAGTPRPVWSHEASLAKSTAALQPG